MAAVHQEQRASSLDAAVAQETGKARAVITVPSGPSYWDIHSMIMRE